MFCHGTQTMGFVTVCCSMGTVSKILCSHFSDKGRYYGCTHAGLNFTMKSGAESLVLMSVIMHGPYLKQTQLLCMIWQYCLWAACPCLSWSFTMKSGAESLVLMSVIMHGLYLKQTQLLCMIWWYRLWAACPCLSWSAVAFSRSIGVELDDEDL